MTNGPVAGTADGPPWRWGVTGLPPQIRSEVMIVVILLFAGSLATFCGVCIWATRGANAVDVDFEIPDTVPTEWSDIYRS